MTSAASTPPPAPDGRRERWRAHREQRRTELIAAVVSAVRERGAGVGMDDVTAVSGIAKPVFYRYFAGKGDLYRAVGRSVAEEIVAEVNTVVGAEEHPRRMLTAGIDAFLRRIEADAELYRFVLHPPLDRQSPDTVGDYSSVLGLQIARIIGDRMRADGLDSGAAEPWGFGIVGTVRTAGERWLEQRTMSRDALAAYLTELLWSGCVGAYRSAAAQAPAADVADDGPGLRAIHP